VRHYTTFVLFFKFVLNLSVFDPILKSRAFLRYSAWIKIGIYDWPDMSSIFIYMMPEVLIICFIMLHEIKLQLLGLYDETEEDIEPVLDGIQRNLLRGDEEAVRLKRV
jgi:hypothetical protein